MTNMLLMIGTSELLLIAALVLLLFGGKKLPEMMKGLGQGVRSFKEGVREKPDPDEASDNDSGQVVTAVQEKDQPSETAHDPVSEDQKDEK